MKIIIAGGTGFVGRYLIAALLAEKNDVWVLSRDAKKVLNLFQNTVHILQWDHLQSLNANDFDAVINLAGQNIGECRWTAAVKKNIKDSRVTATRLLSEWCAKANNPPHLYNASAIGVYGAQPIGVAIPTRLTEATEINFDSSTDFLSEVGRSWERALSSAIEADVPVTVMRFAPVLKRDEGMLKKLQPIFNIGLGGTLGSGMQACSWVHVDDLVNAIKFLLNHPQIVGPVNISAPECVAQKVFAENLAQVMHRPALLPTPAWVLRLRFGQMAEELLLSGQNMYPEKLLANGFSFLYPTLAAALRHDWN